VTGKSFDLATEEIEEALALFPDEAELLATASDIQRRMRKLPEAETYLRRAEAVDPSHDNVMSAGADLAFDRKDFGRAASLYRQLVDRKPHRYYYSRLVQALNRLGDPEQASQTGRQGLERFPDDPWLLRGLAAAEAKLGHRDEAMELYEKVLELDPKDRFTYKELMRLRTSDTSAEKAASALKGLMRSGDRAKNPHLKTLAADRLRKAGKDEEAAVEYEAALALEPGNAYALAQLGFCYRRLGRTDEAIETLGQAFVADPNNVILRKTLESMSRSANRLEELAALIEEAIRRHPETKMLYGMRKRVLRGARSKSDIHEGQQSGKV
jgi:tetratricopeptide (TPR) repeat protein